ncbi:YqgE/AlgH family protein [Lysobacter sp. GX 14042]|uniref:YqgE/AlgH family protein n=1 Tax=Lysobacter sp. GX 14042 TaxID=2907155 RepID=UPI001F33B50C|nr:YqgE/AlgH family protein [Lysobacter sp. GX 14042]MCE7031873.1 YqgE/AlgH family protein [Lysobacter sp. GX 14042]
MPAMLTPVSNFANQLLIALPSLAGSGFSRSVALICQHDEDGAMGIVVNRASEYTIGEVLGQMGVEGGSAELRARPVLAGGPVHPERGFVIHDGGMHWDSSLEIADGLYLTTSREILEDMAGGGGPEHAVVALGCAGWESGQLEQELAENDWLTAPADPELLFQLPLETRWEAAAGRIGVDFTHLADYAGHA